jgi:restriction system protein
MNAALLSLTPRQFEVEVRRILDAASTGLNNYESQHLEAVQGSDGAYVFDVTARFSALGAAFLVLIECKHQARDVERSDVQILYDKMRSVGAQKAMLFSISGFQSGAIEYATQHHIALIQLQDESTCWIRKSLSVQPILPSGKVVGWLYSGLSVSLVSFDEGRSMREALMTSTTDN